MKNFILLITVFLLLSLTGCSHDAARVEPAPLPKFKTTVSLKEIWNKDLGSVEFAGHRLEPLINEQQIIAGNTHGSVILLDAEKGKTVWQKKISVSLASGLITNGEHLYLANRKGEFFAFLQSDKGIDTTPVWKKRLSSEVLAPAAASENIVAVQTVDGHLYALNADTGEQLWVYATELPNLTLRGGSRPQFASGAVVAGFPNGKLVVIDEKTGLPIWEKNLAQGKGSSEFDQLNDIDGDFVLANNTLYVGNYQGQVAAIDLFSGRVIWTRDISTYVGLFEDAGQLYVSDSGGIIWALDSATGSTLWSQPGLKARQLSAPTIYGDLLVVGDFQGYLHLLSKQNGQFVGRQRIDHQGIKMQPQLYQEHLLVMGQSGQLMMLEKKP